MCNDESEYGRDEFSKGYSGSGGLYIPCTVVVVFFSRALEGQEVASCSNSCCGSCCWFWFWWVDRESVQRLIVGVRESIDCGVTGVDVPVTVGGECGSCQTPAPAARNWNEISVSQCHDEKKLGTFTPV